MAAILCKSIGELCNSLGQILWLPCKACGFGCNVIEEVIKSPFFPYLATTFALNVPPVVYAIYSFQAYCPDLAKWILINGSLCLVHLIGSIYIVRKIQESHDDGVVVNPNYNDSNNNSKINEDIEQRGNYYNFSMPKENEYGARNSCARIKYVLCYDGKMAIYIVVSVFWMCWQGYGVSKWIDNGDSEDCYELSRYIGISISLGYAYMCMVFCAFACSLCCLR